MCNDDSRRRTTIFSKTPTTVTNTVNVLPQSQVDTLLADAAALAGFAVSPLIQTANDLEEAGRRYEVIADLAREQIDTLADQALHADEQAEANYDAARGIRTVLGAVA